MLDLHFNGIVQNETDEKGIFAATGSVCVEPDRKNFLTYSTKVDIPSLSSFTQSGLNSCKVLGMGFVLHSIKDTNGMLRTLKLMHYHVPNSKHKIIATSEVLDRYEGETISITANGLTLSGIEADRAQRQFCPKKHVFKPSSLNCLPLQFEDPSASHHPELSNINLATIHNNNANLSPAKHELLKWHQRLAHISFAKVQHLMRSEF